MEFHGIWLYSQIPWNFENSIEFHGTSQLVIVIPWNLVMKPNSMELLKFHGIPWNFYSRCGDSMEFHGIPWNLVLASNSMELPFWHGKVPWNSMEFHGTSGEFHGIPWNSMELWNIDIIKFHNWGSVFHCFLYDFMSLYIRQSISSWNIEIFQFQSNFLVPLILVKWRYSILNGGLLYMFISTLRYWYMQGMYKWTAPHISPINKESLCHCNDVIMGAMAFQITSLTTVCSTVYSGADKRKHQSSASMAFVRRGGGGGRNSPVTGEFHAQIASNAENVSIWWRHYA